MTSKHHHSTGDDDNSKAEPQLVAITTPIQLVADGTPDETILVQLAVMKDRWMRAEAENANIRTRAKRDVEEARSFAVQKFASDAIETAENMHRALERMPPASQSEPDSIAGLRTGLLEIERGFTALLQRNGVTKQDPAGLPFDPNLHQAMAEQESVEHPKGTIIETHSPAWILNGRLLKPAMVVVAKSPMPPN